MEIKIRGMTDVTSRCPMIVCPIKVSKLNESSWKPIGIVDLSIIGAEGSRRVHDAVSKKEA